MADCGQRRCGDLGSVPAGPSSDFGFGQPNAPYGVETLAVAPWALILNELLSNAFKHAFPEGRGGRILVSFREAEPGSLELAVQDDGIGSPAGIDSRNAESLGLRIVGILTRQLDGVLAHAPCAGTRLVFGSQPVPRIGSGSRPSSGQPRGLARSERQRGRMEL